MVRLSHHPKMPSGKKKRIPAPQGEAGDSPAAAPAQARSWHVAVLGLLLAAMAVGLYVRSVGFSFVNFDDDLYVTQNKHVQAGLTLASVAWAFTTFATSNWHPLTWLSHMLTCQIFGLSPGGHHLMSLLFHALNCLLLFYVLYRMTGRIWPSFFVAALFGFHPLRVESVAWVSERKDVLSACFWLLALLAYVRYARKPSWAAYLWLLLAFLLGLMSKPMVITLPVVLLLLDFWPLGRMRLSGSAPGLVPPGTVGFWRLVLEKLPLLALAAGSAVVTIYASRSQGAMPSFKVLPLTARLENAVSSCVGYMLKTLWPQGLGAWYPVPEPLVLWKVLAAGLVLAGFTWGAVAAARRHPYLLVGWLSYLAMLLPVIGILQAGEQAMADRYTYLPSIGLALAVTWSLADIIRQRPSYRQVVLCAGVAVSMGLATLTWFQAGRWRNTISILRHTVEAAPDSYWAHNNLGAALQAEGRLEEAKQQLMQALAVRPEFADAQNNLGFVLEKQGRVAEAVDHYRRALRINPKQATYQMNLERLLSHIEGAGAGDQNRILLEAMGFTALGSALLDNGQLASAQEKLNQALHLVPDYVPALYKLGNLWAIQGRFDQARMKYQAVLQIEPEHADAHNNLAVVLAAQGQVAEAVRHFEAAGRLGDVLAKRNLAVSAQGRGSLESAP